MREGQIRYADTSAFEKTRSNSASEAVLRIFQFNIIERHPTVVRLNAHLGYHHTVYFREDGVQAAVGRRRPGTKLTKWFAANEK